MGQPLCQIPTMDSSGRISAREAFAYADDVHHSYDSPVYSAYGTDAGDQHLHQRWLYLIVYCKFVLKELRLLRDVLPDPIQYRHVMRAKVLPVRTDLDDKWAVRPPDPGEAQKMIAEMFRSVAK